MLRISSFSIDGLNGLFNYQDCAVQGMMSDLIILYGDNGCGKTTILNLIFHLLSPEPKSGHLTAISMIPFRKLKVNLSDNTVVSAERSGTPLGFPIIFRVARPKEKPVEYKFIPDNMQTLVIKEMMEREFVRNKQKHNNDHKSQDSWEKFYQRELLFPGAGEATHKKYLDALNNLNLKVYLMATDRLIRSDHIESFPDNRATQSTKSGGDDVISQVRAKYLSHALNQASRYINRQIIKASDKGSKNTNDIYAELIKRVAGEDTNSDESDITNVLKTSITELSELEKQNTTLSSLGIAPALDFYSILNSVATSAISSRPFLEKILRPYIDSLNAQYAALNAIGEILKTYLSLLNDLFKYKSLSFSPNTGFTITGVSGDQLDPENLSSGEQQLLLIFCNLLVATEHQSVFMIDEPEISLNVKWQRDLIDAMRAITKNSKTQIVIATHSIELLTQYSDTVIQLDPKLSEQARPTYESPAKEN